MKHLIKTIFCASCCVYLTGCTSQETFVEPPTIIEEITIESSEDSQTETGTEAETSQLPESEPTKNHFSHAGIAFEYPSDLKVQEISGEDGSKNEFTSESGELLFWYEQGENWRVDMTWDQNAYQDVLASRYPDAVIDEYAKTTMNDIEMLYIVFHLPDQSSDVTYKEYILVGQYAFYDFYFINAENDFANEVMGSVNLIEN